MTFKKMGIFMLCITLSLLVIAGGLIHFFTTMHLLNINDTFYMESTSDIIMMELHVISHMML